MNIIFNKLLDRVKKLKLPNGKWVIFGSGPLVVRGLKEPHDIDILRHESSRRYCFYNTHHNNYLICQVNIGYTRPYSNKYFSDILL